MPTTRRRYQVTETSALERAIETALQKWPGETRSGALLRLIDVGASTVEHQLETERRDRRAALERLALKYDGLISTEDLALLRQDWPT